jgi:hypothetical protein
MSDCQGVLGYGMFSLSRVSLQGAILTLSQRMTSEELLASFAGSLEGTIFFFHPQVLLDELLESKPQFIRSAFIYSYSVKKSFTKDAMFRLPDSV